MTVAWYAHGDDSGAWAHEIVLVYDSWLMRSVRFAAGQNLLLDGPYGQDFGLRKFDTVILTVRGGRHPRNSFASEAPPRPCTARLIGPHR